MASTVQRCARLSLRMRPSTLLKLSPRDSNHSRSYLNTLPSLSLHNHQPPSLSASYKYVNSLPASNPVSVQPSSLLSTCPRLNGLFNQAPKKDASTTSSTEDSEEGAAHASPEEMATLLKKSEELLGKVEADNKKIVEERDELKDKYKRSLAETENVRNRMQKQISDAKVFGIQGFCKDLLEVADILEKAVEATPKDKMSENQELKDLFDGLTMTETQLLKVFGKHGLVRVDPAEGDKFDPNLHEALFQLPAADKEHNTIAVVTQKGFALNGRTLRAAKVGVVKNS